MRPAGEIKHMIFAYSRVPCIAGIRLADVNRYLSAAERHRQDHDIRSSMRDEPRRLLLERAARCWLGQKMLLLLVLLCRCNPDYH